MAIASRTGSNDGYSWTGDYVVDRAYAVNGLNQLTGAGGNAIGYDDRGNLTSSAGTTFTYCTDNEMATAVTSAGTVGMAHDPLGRLFNINAEGGVNTTLVYDGADLLGEVNQDTGGTLRRYVHGPGTDEPLVWYEGAGLADRRFLHADERGSVVAVSDGSGAATTIYRYDAFGIPETGRAGRFRYTGQKWLPSVGLYDYKARMYSPTLGRFMQTDPIGYADGLNWYDYVGGDPVNNTDPSGLNGCQVVAAPNDPCVVNGRREASKDFLRYFGSSAYDTLTAAMERPTQYFNHMTGWGPQPDARTIANGSAPQNNQSKPLPPCLQKFLKGRLKSNPANIRLHQGSPFELTGNSVTFGNDVYLAGDTYGRSDRGATIHKFHEIQHTSQYARGYSALNQAFAYVAFGGHDASPFEQAADTFAQDTYNDYKAAGLDKSCPF